MSQPFGWQGRQEVVHLRVLLKGFGYILKKSIEIWKDSVSCIMMGETLTNRDLPRHVDVKVQCVVCHREIETGLTSRSVQFLFPP